MSQTFADQGFEATDGMLVGSQLLHGQFLIQACLQQGGFGIAYVARDSLDRQVVVKECFPAHMCRRVNGQVVPLTKELTAQFSAIKKQFVREARQMAKLTHPNVLGVHQVFEENNTAYMALDHVVGLDLISVSEDQPERLTNSFLVSVLEQMLEAITFIHKHGVLHRDISPDNILVDDNGHVTLIDFGAAQEHTLGGGSNFPTIMAVKDGYSPHEFYTTHIPHDFSSDLYSLGATLYHLITGYPPVSGQDRLTSVSDGGRDPYVPLVREDWGYDYNILATVDSALALLQENRFQSAASWLTALRQTPAARPKKPAKPAFDPNLDEKIAQIVARTNTDLTPATPLSSSSVKRRSAPSAAPVEETSKAVVDIFGNPIEDVAAWQAEQEAEIAAWNAQRQAEEEAARMPLEPIETEKKSKFARLISRCLPGRSNRPSS